MTTTLADSAAQTCAVAALATDAAVTGNAVRSGGTILPIGGTGTAEAYLSC
jgi:hypothetical protein